MLSADEAIAQLREATQSLAAKTQHMRESREKQERMLAEADKDRQESRRRGENGRDWQILQQRIDLGQTTEFDIVQGFDHSNEARAVRKQMGEDIGRIADIRAKEGEGSAGLPPEFSEAQERLVATLARLRSMTPGQ